MLHLPVSLAGPGRSGGAHPSRRCRGRSHPPLRLQAQAPSFSGLLRQAKGGVLSPPPDTWRLVAHQNSAPERRCPDCRHRGQRRVWRPSVTQRSRTDRPIGRCQAYWRRGVVRTLRRELAGRRGRQAASSRGQRSRRSWAQSGTKIAPWTLPWSPERSVQTLCPGARPASTSGFTGASSRLEPRPSPFHGDALPGSTTVPICPLTWAFERTTGLEPATLTLARRPRASTACGRGS
jgi:hypothetical protein